MVIKVSQILKGLGLLLLVVGLVLVALYFVRLERKVSDLDFRVSVVNKQLSVVETKEKPVVATSPTASPSGKLKVK